MTRYIQGDQHRIFINPSLGCDSSCSYCYLGSQGYSTGQRVAPPQSGELLFQELTKLPWFVKGVQGSVLSIGCYSECWSVANRASTLDFIDLVIPFGNPIQFSTKRAVSSHQLSNIANKQIWQKQVSVFISCASITQWRIYEKGTARPADRFKAIAALQEMGIGVCLYIKPVLDGITILDFEMFCEVLEHSGCPVVVGEQFVPGVHTGENQTKAPIPSEGLFVKDFSEAREMLRLFRMRGYTGFNHSVEAVNLWRSSCP